MSKQVQAKYLAAVGCLMLKTAKGQSYFPAVQSRFDDFAAMHINATQGTSPNPYVLRECRYLRPWSLQDFSSAQVAYISSASSSHGTGTPSGCTKPRSATSAHTRAHNRTSPTIFPRASSNRPFLSQVLGLDAGRRRLLRLTRLRPRLWLRRGRRPRALPGHGDEPGSTRWDRRRMCDKWLVCGKQDRAPRAWR